MRLLRKMIFWSVGITFIGGAIWPFFGGNPCYFLINASYQLLLTTSLLKAVKNDWMSSRGAIMLIIFSIMDMLKICNWALGLNYWWDMTHYHLSEYAFSFTIICLCLIDYRPFFIPILLYILNFNNPCRRRTN